MEREREAERRPPRKMSMKLMPPPFSLPSSSVDAEALPTAAPTAYVAPTPVPSTRVTITRAAHAADDDVFRFLISTDNHLVRKGRQKIERTRGRAAPLSMLT